LESSYNLSGTAKGMTTGFNGGSEFRLGGSEDLGNGLKADFSWAFVQNHNNGAAYSPATVGGAYGTTAGAVTSYNSFVGLSGDFGSLKLGQQWAPLTLVTFGNDAAGGIATSGNLSNSVVQVPNSITYATPTIAGVTLTAQADSVAANQTTGYSLTYGIGAFNAGYGYSLTQGGTKSLNAIGASYDFGMAKLFVSSLTQSGADSATGYGVSIPFGAATFIGSGSTKGTADNYTLIAKYALSKRTGVYFQNASASKAVTNSVGVSHAF
jgi:predicted porin